MPSAAPALEPAWQVEHTALQVARSRRKNFGLGGDTLPFDLFHELVVLTARVERAFHARGGEVLVVCVHLARRQGEDERVEDVAAAPGEAPSEDLRE